MQRRSTALSKLDELGCNGNPLEEAILHSFKAFVGRAPYLIIKALLALLSAANANLEQLKIAGPESFFS